MRILPLILAIVACSGTPAPSSPEGTPVEVPPDASATAMREQALVAYQSGDLDTFVSLQEQVVQSDEVRMVDRYNLACGYARTGKRDQAIAELRALLDAGVDYGAAQDADFRSLTDDPEFQQIVMAFDALHPEVHHSVRFADLGDRNDLAPEGVAYDGSTGRTFVSTMRTGEIFVLDAEGAAPFAALEVDGTPLSAFGLEVDEARGVLWAVGASFSLHKAYDPEHANTTGVFGFDLATGEQVASHTLVGGPEGGFNDLVIGEDGTIYVSGGALYVLRPEADRLTPLTINPPFEASNGLTFGVDSDVLFVAANRQGVARVDLRRGDWSWVKAPEGEDLRSIDGLEWADGSLVAVQLGMRRWRAVRLDLNEPGSEITGVEVLEQGHPEIAFATNGVLVGGKLRYVSRAPLPPGTNRAEAGPAAGQTVLWEVPVRPSDGQPG